MCFLDLDGHKFINLLSATLSKINGSLNPISVMVQGIYQCQKSFSTEAGFGLHPYDFGVASPGCIEWSYRTIPKN